MEHDLFDCIVIGAGPAGLSASLFLARYRRNVLTLHDNQPRNTYSHGIHGFLGHHGIAPAELLARGIEEVITHGGKIIEARVTRIEKSRNGSFTVITEREGNRPYLTRRVLLSDWTAGRPSNLLWLPRILWLERLPLSGLRWLRSVRQASGCSRS